MRILTIGDVCSPSGVTALIRLLPKLKREFLADAVIVNGENSALGNGITKQSAMDIFSAGADVITGGNHTLRRPEVFPFLDENPFVLRPHNIEADVGRGYCLLDLGSTNLAVINLSGQIYLERANAQNPFLAADELIEKAKSDGAKNIV
ncbi:MAG: YmdB family metallophosphoesterase, partial [Clostridia bacterium]|nr:YmdB family metallophosphoesterase [Clostridia bacterium]